RKPLSTKVALQSFAAVRDTSRHLPSSSHWATTAATAGETFCPGKPSKTDSDCQGFRDDMGMTAANSPAHLAALLERVRAGDEPALTELIQHYEPRLRTAAHVLLGPLLRPSMDSVDLVQSV